MADDGEPGHVGTREAVPGDSSPGDDLASAPSARSPLWPSLSAFTRRPERLAALILGLGVLLIALWEGSLAIRQWLHNQPIHQIEFRQIELEPPPPAYIKLGTKGLLDQIRQRANLPEIISILDIDLDALARSISLHEPWIKSVDHIESSYPNRLVVRVTYREPVAKANLARAGQVVLDREGVVLETSELDPIHAGPLMTLTDLDSPRAPLDPKVGVSLGAPGSKAESLVSSAVKLADFLRNQTRGGPDHPRSPITFVQISTLYGPDKLSALTSDGLWVRWGRAPGSETESEPSALAKWSMLTERLALPENRNSNRPNDLLVFHRHGVEILQGVTPTP